MDARLELVETAYRFDVTEEQQLALLLKVMARRFERRRPMFAFTSSIALGKHQIRSATSMHADEGISAKVLSDPLAIARTDDIRRMWCATPARHTLGTLVSDDYRASLSSIGIPDFVGLNCPTGHGTALVVGTVWPDAQRLRRGERAFWGPVARHLARGLCLREQVRHEVDAIFRVDRDTVRVEDLSSAASARSDHEALHAVVLHRERVRSHRRSSQGELWPDLVCGRWTIVDRFEDNGRRYAIAVRNSDIGGDLHTLSQRDHWVIQQLARGVANKAIAIDLGVSEWDASRTIDRVLARMGLSLAELLVATRAWVTPIDLVASRVGLIELPGLSRTALQLLAPAERATAAGVLRGHDNRRIAQVRGVKERTVINQIASACEKLSEHSKRGGHSGVPAHSRRELILALIQPDCTQCTQEHVDPGGSTGTRHPR